MAKLMPGRVRNEGIKLFEKGLIAINQVSETQLDTTVGQHHLIYALDDPEIMCDCDFFAQKGYCSHLAAVEYYLKNAKEGQYLLAKLEEKQESAQDQDRGRSFGGLFLEGLSLNEDDTVRYSLTVEGEESTFGSEIWWSLRLRRLPDERSYVIRDIPAFLKIIETEGYYQIGKNYYEPLSLIQFDQASQAFLDFLGRMIPDEAKTNLTFILPNNARHLSLPYGFFEEGLRLMQDLDGFRFEWEGIEYRCFLVEDLTAEANLFSFDICVEPKMIELTVTEKNSQTFFNNRIIFYQGVFYRLNRKQQKILLGLRSLPIGSDLNKHVSFNLEEQAILAASLSDFKTMGPVKAPKAFNIKDFTPRFHFDLKGEREVVLTLAFDFDGYVVDNRYELSHLGFTSNYRHEQAIFRLMVKHGFTPDFQSSKRLNSNQELYDFFINTLPAFENAGPVLIGQELCDLRVEQSPQIQVERQGNLLDISFDFSSLNDEDVDHALEALMARAPYFVNRSGQLIVFDEGTQRINESLRTLRARYSGQGHLELHQLAAYQLMDSLSENDSVRFSEDFQQLAQHLRKPETFDLPSYQVEVDLRPYQERGVQWLSMLHHYSFGGILADDMGLGKTLQTIAYLSAHLEDGQRVLVLSPSSLVYNWQDEFKKFAPQLDVAVSYGLKPKRDEIIAEDHQIIITSYASFRQDFDVYKAGQYDYLILDEAQVMKNTQTKIAQYLRDFSVPHCLALSGTPIENHLSEIWSIFQIVLPGLLPAKKTFLKLTPMEVARYITPFILRRKKDEVLPDLPNLIEITHQSELSDSQKSIYLAQLQQMQQGLISASDQEINRRRVEILSGITRLRQICDTPALFMDYAGDSGKLDSLRDLLSRIKESDHRVLIFSQFRGMLDIAEELLQELGISSYKLTGSTPSDSRQEMTRAFNQGSRDAFLISLKAGGVGLNLTGADTVILIDLWWNPAVEMQAISRAHRIGQEQNVKVFRLITRGTIEEKILELQEGKKNLVTTVLDGNESCASMTVEDIKEILGIAIS
ncbi:RNA helicase [Streptococcus thermophilus]|uniref:RNA helicase n=1 Tax=Streptococcus thermophilus TaxID=1308 RepID=A0A8D6U8P8_STRTR|nr:DEAD/DEAH box helicase [Streptococcus thermophilus]CAD0136034.1 RNA helicase [Streptococcus thermophilus]